MSERELLDQEASDLAALTTMSYRTTHLFLWILTDWQHNAGLTDTQVAEVKQAALDAASVTGDSPVDILVSMREVLELMKEQA